MIQRLLAIVLLLLLLLPALVLAQTPAWQPGTHYATGTLLTYNGATYKCLQAHNSQIAWNPVAAPALWQLVSGGGGGGSCATLPAVPTGLTASSTSSTGTTLSWNASSAGTGCTVTGYTVTQNGVSTGTASMNTFMVGGLSPASNYSFTVAAIDSYGSSAPSAPLSVATLAGGSGRGCAPPWSASAVYTGGQTASVNGVNYKTNWWTQGQNPATNSGPSGSGQPWTTTGVCAACNALPATPAGLAASGTTAYSTTLTWTAVAPSANCPISGYTVYVDGQPAGTAAGTFVATGLTPTTSYRFTVAANDAFGSSPQSAAVSVTTLASVGGGGRMFAPYIDLSLTSSEQLLAIQQQSGIKMFTLAFVLSSGGCTPAWGGTGSIYNDTLPNGATILSLVQGVRNAGAGVIVSFGGANGVELAQACPDVASLQAAYQSVITRYSVHLLDFDIEGGAVADQASITRRNKAIVGLKAANPGLVISYTLPVLPTGLVSDGVNILNRVKADGLSLDVVNVMAMDYGANVDNGGNMGLDATLAASNTYQQIQAAGLTATVGVTPMIGVNDTAGEVFQLADAQTLLNFAQANSYITRLAMWSVGRDNGSCAGNRWASASCSGLAQSAYQFSGIFQGFR